MCCSCSIRMDETSQTMKSSVRIIWKSRHATLRLLRTSNYTVLRMPISYDEKTK